MRTVWLGRIFMQASKMKQCPRCLERKERAVDFYQMKGRKYCDCYCKLCRGIINRQWEGCDVNAYKEGRCVANKLTAVHPPSRGEFRVGLETPSIVEIKP